MIKRPDSMRPGVFIHTSVRPYAGGCPAGRGVAVAARAGAGYSGAGLALLYTLADAAAFGTESVLYGMAQTLLAAGVVPVYAAAAGEDYAAALAALETEENLFAVVCDGGAEALCAHVDACCAAGRERVGLLAVSGTEAARETAAAADNRRVAVLCDGGTNTARTAAAFAAALAAANAGSLSGLAVPLDIPFDGGLTAAETEELLRAGVTPFERCGGEVRCVRALTTSRTVNGLPDNTFSALSTVLAVDEVVGAVRRAVRARLRGLKNNAVTRESIASQITVELERERALGVIDSYRPPRVAAHPDDASVCVATLSLRVAPEINQIVIAADIVV